MPTMKETLVPVQVPWMVSPSVPHVRLIAPESQSDGSAAITFIAHFGLEHLKPEPKDEVPTKVFSPYDAMTKLGPPEGPFQLIRIRLISHIASRMLPGLSDSEVIAPDRYDMTAIPCGYLPGQGVKEWLRQFQDSWRRQGRCPDPRMYEIKDSLWREELGASGDFKHVLILGHDAYVEAIAKNWEWASDGRIPT
jgi:hypothetical protein